MDFFGYVTNSLNVFNSATKYLNKRLFELLGKRSIYYPKTNETHVTGRFLILVQIHTSVIYDLE